MTLEAEVRSVVERVVDRALAGGAGDVVAVASDHGGFALKQQLVPVIEELGFAVRDCGSFTADAVDYPDFAHAAARLVSNGECAWGVVVDGAGIGSAMVANKVPGVRAALCYDLSSARNSREHNHANVLSLGAGLVGPALACQIVREWFGTSWGGDRHAHRVAKITEIEEIYLLPREGR